MRRILLGSILLSWIMFMASVTVGGIGLGKTGLLQEMQAVLMGMSLSFETARAILTGVVVAVLSVALWALMIAVSSDDAEHRDRVVSVGGAFAVMLLAASAWMLFAVAVGAGQAVGMLFAIQVATLLSMLAAGGVEFAWEARPVASVAQSEEDGLAARFARHLAVTSARLSAIGPADRNGERG
ncbi:MAG: hypothetical protein WAU86_12210 [Oricola sp.]